MLGVLFHRGMCCRVGVMNTLECCTNCLLVAIGECVW